LKSALPVLLLSCILWRPLWGEVIREKFRDKGKKATCEITASLPDRPNPALKNLTTEHIKSFKKEYRTSDYDGSFGWYLKLEWRREFAHQGVISYLLVEESYQGGAHPSHSQIGLMISPKNQKPIKLAQCFKNGSPWLQTMADYCKSKLKENQDLDSESIELGAAPKAENYGNVLAGPKGLTVFFQEYQVGPYAAGPQEVLVPYSVLAPHFNPDGPLAGFVL